MLNLEEVFLFVFINSVPSTSAGHAPAAWSTSAGLSGRVNFLLVIFGFKTMERQL